MRKESAIIFLLALVISAGIVGGASFWYSQKISDQASYQSEPALSLPTIIETKRQAPQRTNTPIECTLPDGSTFWTNTTRCEDADLNNRISGADPVDTTRLRNAEKKRSAERRARQTISRVQKPNIRGPGRPPPSGLKAGCSFPVGMALEKERMLAAAKDPLESIYRKSYCRFRKEALEDQCMVPDSYFYYRYNTICWDRYSTDYQ